ncbi:MAG: permease-like cell division protein FtsX [Tatlockia sp.]|jgi:cell division transport system permease protein
MLTRINALISYHLHAAGHSLNLLCRKPVSTMMTVIVIAIALALPTLFWVFIDNLNQITRDWQRNGHISLYLKPSLKTAEEAALLRRIQATQGVGHALFKSANEGLAELKQQEGMHDIMRYLPENPLPAVIEVIPALSISTPAEIEQLFSRLQSFPEIEQAKIDMQWINRLHAVLGFVGKTVHALMALLALAVVLIIGNTLRLAIHNRQEEIQVLKLLGAKDSYIARPFLYSGIWYSLAGAVFAVLFVNIFMLSLAVAFQKLAFVYQMHYPMLGLSVKQAYSLVFISTFLGFLGAKLSIKKQIASIEPYG